ncbi:MAG TPA: hypothetical protein VKM56_01135, partial [Verrucomicrobiae bacterium]|nr:hypothetical protein [Verrucomicrobiae bacterium]
MHSKTSSALFVAVLLLAGQFSLSAQSQDCYYIQCPTNIYAPCEGVWGAHVWYSVIASNRCNPSAPPTVTYSIPPGSAFPSGTNIVCATIQIPGLPARNCCFEVIVDKCCSTNCIDLVCPPDLVVGCQQTAGPP